MVKTCSRCKKPKDSSRFYKRKKGRPTLCSWCMECTRSVAKNKFAKAFKGKSQRTRWLRLKYDLTEEDIARMHHEQDWRCAICCKKKKLVIDHCHNSGRVRGLLCVKCNSGLGYIESSPEWVGAALRYLERHG